MMDRARSNLIFAHQEWIGFVQPVGLLLSPIVMVDAQVVPDRNISGRQREFRELLEENGSGCHGPLVCVRHPPSISRLSGLGRR